MKTALALLLALTLAPAAEADSPERRIMRVPSETMVPTIQIGDRIEVDAGAYEHAKPQLLDIVVAVPPKGADDYHDELALYCGDRFKRSDEMCEKARPGFDPVLYVKRIVGLPGDRLSLRHGRLYRNGRRMHEPYTAPCGRDRELCHLPRTITVPRGRYYLMGDNRGSSFDSRLWGGVPRTQLARVERVIKQ